MSHPHGTNSTESIDAIRHQMERCIDELAALARSHEPEKVVEPGLFFGEVLQRALHPGGAVRAILWRPTNVGAWEPAGGTPSGHELDSSQLDARRELMLEVSKTSVPKVVGAETNGRVTNELVLLSPLCHFGQTVGILETCHSVSAGEGISATTYQFFAALGEIAADYLSQQELRQLRAARQAWQQWDQYVSQIQSSSELKDVCATIANDGRQLVGCDRISVLLRKRRGFQLEAVSGVERINARSDSVRILELLAKHADFQSSVLWQPVSGLEDESASRSTQNQANNVPFDVRLIDIVRQYSRGSGTKCIGLVPVVSRNNDSKRPVPIAVLVFEQFEQTEDWSNKQSRAEMLCNRSMPSLRNAVERREIPFLGLWNGMRRSLAWIRQPGLILALILLSVATAVLTFVPLEFTVTGQGELLPDRRRDVFAGTSGIVDQILVEHGVAVKKDQPLIVLRDHQLEQELPKVLGEIATINESLRGIQTARLSGMGNSPDSGFRFRQLTSDEAELKERLKTLEQQRRLLLQRQTALTLCSPIDGTVLTWDVAQHLSARPVDRGQVLLTVGDTDGPWIVEVRVADKDAGHILRARRERGPILDVDFLLASDPRQKYRGKVRDVSLATETDEQSNGYVCVIVEINRAEIAQLRPGATAIPRIRCGPHPMGYVWLHDLIDAVRTRLLF